jgi:hypothetical protein
MDITVQVVKWGNGFAVRIAGSRRALTRAYEPAKLYRRGYVDRLSCRWAFA